MKSLILIAALMLVLSGVEALSGSVALAQDTPGVEAEPTAAPIMPQPSPPKAPRKQKEKKAPGLIRQKVKEIMPAPVQKGIERSVSVATTTVVAPFSFLKNTLFLVRTELKDGTLLLHFPTVDSDPNRGVTYGLMPVLLVPEKRGDGKTGTRIKTIAAFSLTHNRLFGFGIAARMVHFYDDFQQVSGVASLTERTNRTFIANYSNERFSGKRNLTLRAADEKDGSNRFYGVGMDSKEADQANYTRETLGYRVTFAQPVAKHCNVGVHHRLENFRLTGDGPLKGVPDLDDKYPGLSNDDAVTLAWYRLFTNYDSRDSRTTPTRGHFVNLFWEASPKVLGSGRNMTAWGGDARTYLPHGPNGQGLVFTPRVRWQAVTGNDIPFFALSRLGGKESLRAYGEGRFIDKSMVTAGAEERWTGFRFDMMGTPIEFETGPFVEAGQVFSTASQLSANRARAAAGLFIRGIARPQLVGSLDLGWGKEGPALFLDVDYSW